MTRRATCAAVALAAVGGLTVVADAAPQDEIELISSARGGGSINGAVGGVDVSASGRYVVYDSGADNVVPGDVNGAYDVFLHDRRTGRTRGLTLAGDGGSTSPRVSDDGSRVVFVSTADTLAPAAADNISTPNVFVWSRATGGIRQVDVALDGGAPDSGAAEADISANGRYVTFTSLATDLVGRQVTGHQHVYVRDLRTGRTRVLDPRADGDASEPAIDADGDTVAFVSRAGNLAPAQSTLHATVLVWREGRRLHNLTPSPAAGSRSPAISDTGAKVALVSGARWTAPDTDDRTDVYLATVRNGRLRLVALGSTTGDDQDPTVSGNGRFVGFTSSDDLGRQDTDGQLDAYVWSARRNRVTALTGGAAVASSDPAFSASGSVAAFLSDDLSFVPGDTNQFFDVFVRDLG